MKEKINLEFNRKDASKFLRVLYWPNLQIDETYLLELSYYLFVLHMQTQLLWIYLEGVRNTNIEIRRFSEDVWKIQLNF